jgi:transposase
VTLTFLGNFRAVSHLRKSWPKKRLPEHLPVVKQVIEPAEVQAEPRAWRRIGEEVSEQLDYEPARLLRRRTVRPKYVRHGDMADMEHPPDNRAMPPSL